VSNQKFYITTPIYYVNAKPHIGHAYTTIAADVLSRYHKSMGRDVFFLTGTDEHGAKIAEAAKKMGMEPLTFCNQMAEKFQKMWKSLGIEYSRFIRTTDQDHIEKASGFLEKLKENEHLYEGEYKGLYCVGCEKFLTDKELVDGKCPDHNREPELICEKNWFFRLKKFLPRVKELIEKDKILIAPENSKKEVLGLFKQGLDNFSISRQKVAWGIPLPWDQTQTIYVWVEALLNYWTAVQDENKGKLWPPDVQLMSHDILKFHAIYWPALLLAYGVREEKSPNKIFVHGYFTTNGQKMSKSLGNVIDPNDLAKKYGADSVRYLLMSQFPFGQDGDISKEKLNATYHADLANGLGNLVARVARFGIRNQESGIRNQEYDNLMLNLRFYEVLKLISEKVSECNNLIEKIKPWEIKEEKKQKESLRDVAAEILVIAKMVAPFMPETAKKIKRIFKTEKSEILFPRV